jgi:hypothetical protein
LFWSNENPSLPASAASSWRRFLALIAEKTITAIMIGITKNIIAGILNSPEQKPISTCHSREGACMPWVREPISCDYLLLSNYGDYTLKYRRFPAAKIHL